MDQINFISFLIAPVIALAIILYMNYRFHINSNKNMILAFVFGIVSVAFVVASQFVAEYLELTNLSSIKRSVFYSFVVLAFAAEVGKFLFLRYYFVPRKDFSGPLDGIIYSTLISLGFATAGSIMLMFDVYGAGVNGLYMFIYAIANIVFAIIMGFFVGLGKARQNRLIDSMTGLFVASFFHGLYNFTFITHDYRLLILFAIGSVLIVVLLSVKSLNIKTEESSSRRS